MSHMSKAAIKVIDDQLLLKGVSGEGRLMENITEDSSVVELATVAETLTLSFQNIGKIDNLVGFDMLTKLCLDNNQIERIAGIGHLKKLRWLDLSFNKIRRIEGLENLKLLEDLSLYSNKISDVEGLGLCPKLQCLSLGNNRIDSLEQVLARRRTVVRNVQDAFLVNTYRALVLLSPPTFLSPHHRQSNCDN